MPREVLLCTFSSTAGSFSAEYRALPIDSTHHLAPSWRSAQFWNRTRPAEDAGGDRRRRAPHCDGVGTASLGVRSPTLRVNRPRIRLLPAIQTPVQHQLGVRLSSEQDVISVHKPLRPWSLTTDDVPEHHGLSFVNRHVEFIQPRPPLGCLVRLAPRLVEAHDPLDGRPEVLRSPPGRQ